MKISTHLLFIKDGKLVAFTPRGFIPCRVVTKRFLFWIWQVVILEDE